MGAMNILDKDNGSNSDESKDTVESIRMVEFFSGIGGMRCALMEATTNNIASYRDEEAEAEAEADDDDDDNKKARTDDHDGIILPPLEFCQAYDISLLANATYEHNFVEGTKPRTKLIEQLTANEIDRLHANLWTMSPPCQPFTRKYLAGNNDLRLDDQDKRCAGLKKGIMRLLGEVKNKPRWILLENVKGFAESRMCQLWKACLIQHGYTYREHLLNPAQLGIPNTRLRYYLLCERSNRFAQDVIDGQIEHEFCLPVASGRRHSPPRPISDYLSSNLTEEESSGLWVSDIVLQKPWANPTTLGIAIPSDTRTYCFTAGYGRIYHNATGSLLLVSGERIVPSDSNHTTSDYGESDNVHSIDMMQYSGRLRRFSPRELLRIFGYPPTFELPKHLALEHQYRLIGNSINVTVVSQLLYDLLGRRERTL